MQWLPEQCVHAGEQAGVRVAGESAELGRPGGPHAQPAAGGQNAGARHHRRPVTHHKLLAWGRGLAQYTKLGSQTTEFNFRRRCSHIAISGASLVCSGFSRTLSMHFLTYCCNAFRSDQAGRTSGRGMRHHLPCSARSMKYCSCSRRASRSEAAPQVEGGGRAGRWRSGGGVSALTVPPSSAPRTRSPRPKTRVARNSTKCATVTRDRFQL